MKSLFSLRNKVVSLKKARMDLGLWHLLSTDVSGTYQIIGETYRFVFKQDHQEDLEILYIIDKKSPRPRTDIQWRGGNFYTWTVNDKSIQINDVPGSDKNEADLIRLSLRSRIKQ